MWGHRLLSGAAMGQRMRDPSEKVISTLKTRKEGGTHHQESRERLVFWSARMMLEVERRKWIVDTEKF